MNVLELFSGIGGMHWALSESGVPGNVVAAVEINTVANYVYKRNFPNTKLLNLNIEGLTSKMINEQNINTVLMSPPCQPFTRNGLQNDINDARTASFLNILHILPETNVKHILIENVKGFESSKMRETLVKTLTHNNFDYREFLITPTELGIPNSRLRYYCIAKKRPSDFLLKTSNIMDNLPWSKTTHCFQIGDIIDHQEENIQKYLIPDKTLEKYINLLDICYVDSQRSCCFTKAYSRFIEGTGSVFTNKAKDEVVDVLQKLRNSTKGSNDYLQLAKSLNLRFFTPKEISRLMSFPETFSFPDNLTDRQKYMLLGNSINVRVVANLIELLATSINYT